MSNPLSLLCEPPARRRWLGPPGGPILLVRTLLVLSFLCCQPAVAETVTVRNTAVGKTPRVIGVNSGHYMPGSNTTTWWKYAGVNGGAFSPRPAELKTTTITASGGTASAARNCSWSARDALRADPLNTEYINWPYFENNYANNDSALINYRYAYSELHDLGISPIATIQRSNGAYPFASASTAQGWRDRWEHWQHYYAQAFYLGKNFGVERYQIYNEPDHSSQDISQEEYLERLQLASDAIQSALADVNQIYGKSLTPQVMAPVTAGASGDYLPKPGGDPRDDVTGWGQLVINNLHTNFLGQVDPNFQLVQTYAYQEYNHDGPRFAEELANIKGYVTADCAQRTDRLCDLRVQRPHGGSFQ